MFTKTLIDSANEIHNACYKHLFVQELGNGTLDIEKFKFYLCQDYFYLIEYAKVFALGAIKSSDYNIIGKFSESQNNIINRELDLHKSYMKKLGITTKDLKNTKISTYTIAYTSFMKDIAYGHDELAILCALMPCAISYYEIAKSLIQDYPNCLKENFYSDFIKGYSSKEYIESCKWIFDTIDNLSIGKDKKELEFLKEQYIKSYEFEYLFWEMGYYKKISPITSL